MPEVFIENKQPNPTTRIVVPSINTRKISERVSLDYRDP